MKKSRGLKPVIPLIALVFTMSAFFSACGQKAGGQAAASAPAASAPASPASTAHDAAKAEALKGISGSITAVGSSALQPLAEKAAQMFMEKNKDAKIQVQGGGSGTGLTQVLGGGADIGNSDIFAEEKLPADAAKQLVDHKVCVVGFATVVNPKVAIDNLTSQQVIDIFTGKTKNWKEVGGSDMKIVILSRPASSGTRAAFKKYALKGAEEAMGLTLTEESSGAIKKALADTEGSISYLAFSYIDSSVKALKLDGVEPTAANVTEGKYPIWSYEHMYTKGEPTGLAKAYLDFFASNDFKASVTELGYIPCSDMKISRDK